MSVIPYKIEHWSVARTETDFRNQEPFLVVVDDRAATRMAIISAIRRAGCTFVDRTHWGASRLKPGALADDWNYTMIAIHHAGRAYLCGTGMSQMHAVQTLHRERNNEPAVGYHYAVDCAGQLFEGRDIRRRGAHLNSFNTGVIGIVLLQNLSNPADSSDQLAAGLEAIESLGIKTDVDIRQSQITAVKILVETLRKAFKIAVLGGHKELPFQGEGVDGRLCPGSHGMELVEKLRQWANLPGPTGR